MGSITAEMVKRLREMTGAGMMDCKNALAESGGDYDQAVDILRKKGLKDVGKRAARIAAEGCIGVYQHPGDQIAVVVELNCETDFVARGQEFRELARGLAMHVAAMKPRYVSREEVPEEELARERAIFADQLTEAQKADAAGAEKIISGRLEKYFQEVCLLDQSYIKDETKLVGTLLEELGVKTGEKVVVRRFVRYEVGEGIEKQAGNLAAEVAALTGGH